MAAETTLQGFGATLASTLVGAFVGFLLAGIAESRKRVRDLCGLRNNTIDSIIEELRQLKEALADPNKIGIKWQSETKQLVADIPLTNSAAFDSAVNSGNFSLLPAKLQNTVANLYTVVRQCNIIADQVFQFHLHTINVQDIRRIEIAVNDMQKQLAENCSIISSEVGDVLKALESARR